MTNSRTGAVNIQDELVVSCATKKESAKNKTKQNTAQWFGMPKGQKGRLKGAQ